MDDSGKPQPPFDLAHLRAAVQLRDRCRAAAIAAYERIGLAPSVEYANSTYDAISNLIREDERNRAAGDTVQQCNWCPDPPNPSVRFHPDGRNEHREPRAG